MFFVQKNLIIIIFIVFLLFRTVATLDDLLVSFDNVENTLCRFKFIDLSVVVQDGTVEEAGVRLQLNRVNVLGGEQPEEPDCQELGPCVVRVQ